MLRVQRTMMLTSDDYKSLVATIGTNSAELAQPVPSPLLNLLSIGLLRSVFDIWNLNLLEDIGLRCTDADLDPQGDTYYEIFCVVDSPSQVITRKIGVQAITGFLKGQNGKYKEPVPRTYVDFKQRLLLKSGQFQCEDECMSWVCDVEKESGIEVLHVI